MSSWCAWMSETVVHGGCQRVPKRLSLSSSNWHRYCVSRSVMEQATTSHVSFVLALLILVLAVTSITAFSESKEAEPEDWYAIQRGLRFFASGNYAEAALWFEKA